MIGRGLLTPVKLTVTAGVLLLAMLGWCASADATTGPIWKIESVTTPTNIAPNSPVNQVDQIVVNATSGTFRVGLEKEGLSSPITVGAPASVVESELNFLYDVNGGHGQVVVTEHAEDT